MTVQELQRVLAQAPLVASVQSNEGSPVEHPDTLARLAGASLQEGVAVLRLQGRANIEAVRSAHPGVPTIGLVKRRYEGSEVYITPTLAEVQEALDAGAEVVALDGTARARPNGQSLRQLVQAIHAAGRLAMADCDTVASIRHALAAGADLIGTTLAGYTADSPALDGPALGLLRDAVDEADVPVLAEGRYSEPWHVSAALRIGAQGVVIGGALNDPVKLTRRFVQAARPPKGPVGAVDIGGTWLRFGVFSADWKLQEVRRIPLPRDRSSRLDWIKEQVGATGVLGLGVSSGGTVDPATGEVWEAKAIIPGHVGTVFNEETLGMPTVALNDGLASAWGHACLPKFAGKRVATLALGTGVGCGFVADGRIHMGRRGEYPRLNDMPTAITVLDIPATIEQLLGGAALSEDPTAEQRRDALQAFLQAALVVQEMMFPDEIVVCGGVGLSDWLSPFLRNPGISASPFGGDAGLYGAAALALWPPV